MGKTHKGYPAGFKQKIVELVRQGRTAEGLSREFEPSAQAIRNWVAQADRDEGRRGRASPAYCVIPSFSSDSARARRASFPPSVSAAGDATVWSGTHQRLVSGSGLRRRAEHPPLGDAPRLPVYSGRWMTRAISCVRRHCPLQKRARGAASGGSVCASPTDLGCGGRRDLTATSISLSGRRNRPRSKGCSPGGVSSPRRPASPYR